MSTENKAVTGRIYGRWEREANNTVIFVSEQDRRIRFRYIGASLQYPSAAQYQCTQCPVIGLMINAEFRNVDPCAGHDCSVSICHPQSTPPTVVAKTAVSEQQSPSTTAPAPRSWHHAKKPKKLIAKAIYDPHGYVLWPSERYPGTTFKFRPNTANPGCLRRHFYCSACANKCSKYESYLKECGISRRHLIVLDDNIIDHHPDDVGTNRGHLCQQPILEEELKAMVRVVQKRLSAASDSLENGAPQGALDMDEMSNPCNADENCVTKTKVVGEPSAKQDNVRRRSLAKRPRACGVESCQHKTFGKIRAVSPSSLTETEHLVWSSSPSVYIHDDWDQILSVQHTGAQTELSRSRDSAVDEPSTELFSEATPARNNVISRQSDHDVGPAVEAPGKWLAYPESTYSVSSAPHHRATDSRSETSDLKVSTTLVDVEREQEPHHFDERREAANVNRTNKPTPTGLKANVINRFTYSATNSGRGHRSVGSPADVKPSTMNSPEVVTIDDSDDDNDANVTSSASSRISKKPAKREPDENIDSERLRHNPAEKFHRFLRESGLLEEYIRESFNGGGEPMAYVQLPHVTEKWIKFNQRN